MSKHLEEKSKEYRIKRKKITILFTDIVGSTKLWEKQGDVKGRMLVDWHNRVLFPVVKKYNGKVVKTIGDAIMASFKSPKKAMLCAIAMQQVLEQERAKRQGFQIHVRIGIHTGEAVVEHNDVFGDSVNIAARVQSEAKGDEIVISESTVKSIKKKDFKIGKQGSFKAKGKSEAIGISKLNWKTYKDLSAGINQKHLLPASSRQQKELMLYFFTCLVWLYFVYVGFVRYILSDSEHFALMLLNPTRAVMASPKVFSMIGVVMLIGVIWFLKKPFVTHFIMRFLKGGFYASVLSTLLWTSAPYVKGGVNDFVKEKFYTSKYLFTEILEGDTPVFRKLNTRSKVLMRLNKGDLLLLADYRGKKYLEWNKVLVGPKQYGWVLRKRPAILGMKETRVSISNRFYLRGRDFIAFLGAIAGFFWGMWRFKFRPV